MLVAWEWKRPGHQTGGDRSRGFGGPPRPHWAASAASANCGQGGLSSRFADELAPFGDRLLAGEELVEPVSEPEPLDPKAALEGGQGRVGAGDAVPGHLQQRPFSDAPSAVRRNLAPVGPVPEPVAMRASSHKALCSTWPSRYQTMAPSGATTHLGAVTAGYLHVFGVT